VVSCNAAGGGSCDGLTGATGATIYDMQGAGCNNIPPTQFGAFNAFNDLIPVVAGNTYVLMVSNWTGSQNGYSIDFGLSTGIGIFDEEPPYLETISGPGSCGGTIIDILFSEYIDCSTIDASNFQLTGPGGPYTLSLDGNACDNGANFEKSFSLIINPPISSMGDFTLLFQSNSSFPLEDLCGNGIIPDSTGFVVDVPIVIPVNIGNDTAIVCLDDTLLLAPFIQGATYVWHDGSTASTYLASQPGTYAVTVTSVCGTGSDSIGVTHLPNPPQFDLGPPQDLCEGESAILDASSPFTVYTWQDGSTGPTFTASQEGTYTVIATNACGTTIDQVFINAVPAIDLDLGGDRDYCKGDTVVLDASNEEATFLWQDGSTGPFFLATADGVYSVAVSTLCETLSDQAALTFIEESSPELGQDTFLCEGDTIWLDFSLPGDNSYLWHDGNTDPVYAVTQGGDIRAMVATRCNTFEDSVFIYFIPFISFDLGRDTFLCEGQYFLDAATKGPASYQWQDGFKEPYYIVKTPGEYSVNVYNECESVSDTVIIKECEFCSFYFPNAFSPNFDGINDEFLVFPECVPEQFHLRVFDRWGAMVFESRDPGAGWDGIYKGRQANPGPYTWVLEFSVIENNLLRKDKASGSVVLLR